MKTTIQIAITLCILAITSASAQQKQRVAIIPSDGNYNAQNMSLLTGKVEEIAVRILPQNNFIIIKQDEVRKKIGDSTFFEICKEGTCVGDIAKEVNANYGARCSVYGIEGKLVLQFELYREDNSPVETFIQHDVNDFFGMLSLLEERLPDAFRKMLPQNSGIILPTVQGGILGVEGASGYVFDGYERKYIVNLNTEPQGANLSFNGFPIGSCSKTPCKVELPESDIRILAALEKYETADTTVSIKQNNQSVNIKLNSNFGVLDIRTAYKNGIGEYEQWNLTLNNKEYYYLENELSPGNYEAKLSHECYEDINFKAGINKGSNEVFYMANHIQLKQGGLILNAEKNGEPVSEPVFENDKKIGETPFGGTVSLCSEISVGYNREKVNVRLKHNEKVTYTHIIKSEAHYSDYQAKPQAREKYYEQPVERSTLLFGVSGILNGYWANVSIYKDTRDKDTEKNSNLSIGGSIGLMAGISLANFALYPEFYLTYRVFHNNKCLYSCSKINELALDIPVLIKLSQSERGGYIEAGVLFGIPLSTTTNYTSETYYRAERDFGYVVGLGFGDYANNLGIRFVLNTSDFAKDTRGSFFSFGFIFKKGWL